MIWRFTIIQDGTETVIDEPPGWDALDKTISRHPEYHGIMFNFSQSNLQFIEDAYWIIKEEYLLRGVDGDVGLRIEWMCDDCEGYQPFYSGKLDFQRYEEHCEADCYITVGLEASLVEVLIDNRMETAVDLTSNKAYDGVTVLTDYPGLNKEIEVPGKGIKLSSQAINEATLVSENFKLDVTKWFGNTVSGGSQQMRAAIFPGFTKTLRTELADTNFYSVATFYNGGFNNRPDVGVIPTIDFAPISDNVSCLTGLAQVSYRMKGVINVAGTPAPSARLKLFKLPAGKDPANAANYSMLEDFNLGPAGTPFDRSNTLSVPLAVGDKLWYYIFLIINPTIYTSYILTEAPECFFDIEIPSLCDPTPANTWMIHEAGSRIVEHITNNSFRFKSAYYGRTDSMPYSFSTNGCGGFRTLTNGLQLRRAKLQDGSEPKVFLSLKDFIDSMQAIDATGMGVEGNDIRVEPIKYFYSDDIIFVADGVDEITTTVRNERIWNTFNFGYDKFETESTNGLDAIHTKRQYRTPIVHTEGKLDKFSKLIADGYAIEETRRKYGTTSDWRYDQNVFILCLTDEYEVEQNNITSPANIFDPATVINYAISPIRNAMRWFNWLVQGVRGVPAKILFNSGEGNYVAGGKLSTGCVLEDGPIAENEPIEVSTFEDEAEALAFIQPEKSVFKYPMGINEFLSVAANKYGKIQYRRGENEEWRFGWIDNLKYLPGSGEATFTLVSKK